MMIARTPEITPKAMEATFDFQWTQSFTSLNKSNRNIENPVKTQLEIVALQVVRNIYFFNLFERLNIFFRPYLRLLLGQTLIDYFKVIYFAKSLY